MKNQKGLTLQELMVTIAVVGILAAYAIPSMLNMLVLNELKTTQESVAQYYRFAKAQAMTRGTFATVSIVASTKKLTVTLANGDWASKTVEQTYPSRIIFNNNISIVFSPSGDFTQTGSDLSLSANTVSIVKTIKINQGGLIAVN